MYRFVSEDWESQVHGFSATKQSLAFHRHKTGDIVGFDDYLHDMKQICSISQYSVDDSGIRGKSMNKMHSSTETSTSYTLILLKKTKIIMLYENISASKFKMLSTNFDFKLHDVLSPKSVHNSLHSYLNLVFTVCLHRTEFTVTFSRDLT